MKRKKYHRALAKHLLKNQADAVLVLPRGTLYYFEAERARSFVAGWSAGVRHQRKREKL